MSIRPSAHGATQKRQNVSTMVYINRLEMIMNKLMLSQFFTSIIVLCATAYQVIMFPTDRMKLVGQAAFLSGETLQLFMYCYFADKISESTGNIGTSAYFSEWYGASQGVKRSLTIIMTRGHRPTFLTVGKFTEMSLDTFASILKASYTYLMMLTEVSD